MPAPKSRKKVNKYSLEMKRTAVRLTHAPGARVKDVAESLDIHPFMLSRWRKLAREGLLTKKGKAPPKSKKKRAPSMVEMSKYAKLKRMRGCAAARARIKLHIKKESVLMFDALP